MTRDRDRDHVKGEERRESVDAQGVPVGEDAMSGTPSEREVRALNEADAAAFRELRLRALRDDPIPFLAGYEEEAARSVEAFATRLPSNDPGTQVFGAFGAEHSSAPWASIATGRSKRDIGRPCGGCTWLPRDVDAALAKRSFRPPSSDCERSATSSKSN
jgi:hypothetical protein